MNIYEVKFGRIKEHTFYVCSDTADKAVDIALAQLRYDESKYEYARADLIKVHKFMSGILL